MMNRRFTTGRAHASLRRCGAYSGIHDRSIDCAERTRTGGLSRSIPHARSVRCTELYAEGAILEFGGTYCRDKQCLERWHRERFASNLDLLRIDSVLVNGNVVTVDGVVNSDRLKT